MRICESSPENLFGNTNDSFIRGIVVNHSDDEFSSSSFPKDGIMSLGSKHSRYSSGVERLRCCWIPFDLSPFETLSCSFSFLWQSLTSFSKVLENVVSFVEFLGWGGSFGRYPLSFGGLKWNDVDELCLVINGRCCLCLDLSKVGKYF